MFWKRKSQEPLEKKEPDKVTAEAEDALTSQPTGSEETDNEPDTDSEEAQAKGSRPEVRPGELTKVVESSEEDETQVVEDSEEDEAQAVDLFEQPNKPEGELSAQPKEEPTAEEKDVSSLLGKAEEEKGEQGNEEEDISFSSLFDEEEEEENPLAGLITSFPDITAQELLEEVQEVKKIVHEWQQT